VSRSPPQGPPRPPLRVVDPLKPDGNLEDHPIAWWNKCKLRSTLSDPPVHTLTTPAGAIVVPTEAMLSPAKLRVAFIDGLGLLPPLPEKNAPAFLREQWRVLLRKRETIAAVLEASNRGTLRSDVAIALRHCPPSDDGLDMERGAILEVRGEDTRVTERLVNARVLYERVRRACPIRFTPAEFYVVLQELGCEHIEKRRVGKWRGRCWSVPAELVEDPPEELSSGTEAATGVHATVAPLEVRPEADPTEDMEHGDAWEPPLPEDDLL